MKTFSFLQHKYGFELLMDLGRLEENPNYFFEPEPHQTTFYEILFIENGEGWLHLDDQRISLGARTIIFLSPRQQRRWFVDKAQLSGYYLSFQEDFLASFFSDHLFVYRLQYFFNPTTPLHITAEASLFAKAEQVFTEILTEIADYRTDSEHLIRSMLYFVLIKMNRAFAETHGLSPDTRGHAVAYRFKHLLETHFATHFSVTAYAALLGISRITLNKVIKRQFGYTATEMIQQRRLYAIQNRLRYSTDTIAEIAFALGFSEAQNLTRFFRTKIGQTPQAYRMTYQRDR